MTFLKGKLTYTMAFLAVLGGLSGWYLGFVDQAQALTMIWGGLSLFGLRRAVA